MQNKRPSVASFLLQLFQLLAISNDSGTSESEVVAWNQTGTAFCIHDIQQFEACILPRHFPDCHKYASFTRRLNRWGFFRCHREPDWPSGTIAYHHDLFRRDEPGLMSQLKSRSTAQSQQAVRPQKEEKEDTHEIQTSTLAVEARQQEEGLKPSTAKEAPSAKHQPRMAELHDVLASSSQANLSNPMASMLKESQLQSRPTQLLQQPQVLQTLASLLSNTRTNHTVMAGAGVATFSSPLLSQCLLEMQQKQQEEQIQRRLLASVTQTMLHSGNSTRLLQNAVERMAHGGHPTALGSRSGLLPSVSTSLLL